MGKRIAMMDASCIDLAMLSLWRGLERDLEISTS